jgi:hypothetical protein
MSANESNIAGLEITNDDSSLRINFVLTRGSQVNISVFNANGSLMVTLAKGPYSEGSHTVTCESGKLPHGALFILLEADRYWLSKKVILG